MTLGGDSDTEAVYAIAVELGHTVASSRKRAPGDDSSQTMNIQIDLGSSDMVRQNNVLSLEMLTCSGLRLDLALPIRARTQRCCSMIRSHSTREKKSASITNLAPSRGTYFGNS
jgi:hypothetical protein